MFKNNIIYPNVIFFICALTIIFALNFIYKKYVSNLQIDTRYNVSATQFFNFKEKAINKTLKAMVEETGDKYLIKDMKVENASITLEQSKSKINFVLIMRKNQSMSAKDIEIKLNKIYLDSINKVIKDIEDNSHLFDYKTLENEWSILNTENKQEWDDYLKNLVNKQGWDDYLKNLVNKQEWDEYSEFFKEYPPKPCNEDKSICTRRYASYLNFLINMVEENYNKLINSEFFKEYPPKPCNNKRLECLRSYVSYYSFLIQMIEKNIAKEDAIKLLRLKSSSNKTDLEILQDLFTNEKLFIIVDKTKDIPRERVLYLQLKDEQIDTKQYYDIDKTIFFSKKYDKFKKTDFYYENIFGDTYCETYSDDCFKKAALKLNKILHEHKLESKNPFTVELIVSEDTMSQQYIIKDAPIVLGLTTILTYLFFILTNKLFRRKLK